jgi:hypothetical protein
MRRVSRSLKPRTPGSLRLFQGLVDHLDIVVKWNKKKIKTAAEVT